MYTIQKHKAVKYIFEVLNHKYISIAYIDGIPYIRCMKNNINGTPIGSKHADYNLESICYHPPHDIRENDNILNHILINIFQIYNISYTYNDLSKCIKFDSIQYKYKFVVQMSDFVTTLRINDIPLVIPSNNYDYDKGGMLYFLIDPLQAIKKLHSFDHIIQQFFKYYRDMIIKQDRESISKYLLVKHLADNFLVMDVFPLIVDNIVSLFLI